MNWASVGLAAVAGGLAALVAHAVVRKPNEKRTAYTVVLVASFAILNALSKEFVAPAIVVPMEMEKAERTLSAIPAFQAMKQHDPATYQAIMRDIREGLADGNREDELVARLRPQIEQIVLKRVPVASDQAVVSYMGVMVRELRELNRQDAELCYKFLFPQQYGALISRRYLAKETQDADLAALAQVIKTSAESPQPVPAEADVSADLELVVAKLRERHGERIAVLQNLQDPSVNKSEGCGMTADLYENILTLPLDRSSRLLRYMLSQG